MSWCVRVTFGLVWAALHEEELPWLPWAMGACPPLGWAGLLCVAELLP